MSSINSIRDYLLSLGGVMVRRNKVNYIAIPAEVDGETAPAYIRADIGMFSTKATKTTPAFNFDEAKAEYDQWLIEHNEREANKGKGTPKDKGGAERTEARLAVLRNWIAENEVANLSAGDIHGIVNPEWILPVTGTLLRKLVDEGLLTAEKDEKGKTRYSKAE